MKRTLPLSTIPKDTRAIDHHVGQKTRALRKAYGLSQQELGQMLGITFQQLQKNECGKNRIGAGRLYQLCCIFHVPPELFFTGLGDFHSVTQIPDKRQVRFSRILELAEAHPEQGAHMLSAIDTALKLLELSIHEEGII